MPIRRNPLSQQVIVITGASSGIGLATARAAAHRGARVVVAARSGDTLATLVREIEDGGGQAVAVVADVGLRADVERIAETAISSFGRIDTWVNVAGVTIYGPLQEISDDDHARLLQTNLWGTVYGSLVAVPHLKRSHGTLINLGSVASDVAFPYQGMYCASKHAIKGFTDALRMELIVEQAPVSVTLIKPNSIDTPLPNRSRNYMDREPTLPPPVYCPEEVANAILHASEHPVRDIIVGGGAKAVVIAKQAAPSWFDLLAPLIVAFQKRAEAPRRPAGAGALYRPDAENTGETSGSYAGHVMKSSAFTRASLSPLASTKAFGLLVLAAGIIAATVLTSRRATANDTA